MAPQGADPFGYAIIIAGAIATAWTFIAATIAFVRPGEREPEHPKYTILRKDR